MASERGGRADKLGNEFERLWAVRHLIEVIAGMATTFRIEALGDDEKGTEFWVGRPDGTREAHQCKRENGAAGKWSVAALESKRIISNAKLQLDRDPSHRFVFASGDKASHLSDLAARAERCDTADEFVTHLTSTSVGLYGEFSTLCGQLSRSRPQVYLWTRREGRRLPPAFPPRGHRQERGCDSLSKSLPPCAGSPESPGMWWPHSRTCWISRSERSSVGRMSSLRLSGGRATS